MKRKEKCNKVKKSLHSNTIPRAEPLGHQRKHTDVDRPKVFSLKRHTCSMTSSSKRHLFAKTRTVSIPLYLTLDVECMDGIHITRSTQSLFSNFPGKYAYSFRKCNKSAQHNGKAQRLETICQCRLITQHQHIASKITIKNFIDELYQYEKLFLLHRLHISSNIVFSDHFKRYQ